MPQRDCPKCGYPLAVDNVYRHPKHGRGSWFVHPTTTGTHLCAPHPEGPLR